MRNQVWEADHKQLPILVLPPRGGAVRPWMTTIVGEVTRTLVGWAIALTPHAGTVLTALRTGLVHDPDRGPFGAVPALVRIDHGLEFAACPVTEVLAALEVDVQTENTTVPRSWIWPVWPPPSGSTRATSMTCPSGKPPETSATNG